MSEKQNSLSPNWNGKEAHGFRKYSRFQKFINFWSKQRPERNNHLLLVIRNRYFSQNPDPIEAE